MLPVVLRDWRGLLLCLPLLAAGAHPATPVRVGHSVFAAHHVPAGCTVDGGGGRVAFGSAAAGAL